MPLYALIKYEILTSVSYVVIWAALFWWLRNLKQGGSILLDFGKSLRQKLNLVMEVLKLNILASGINVYIIHSFHSQELVVLVTLIKTITFKMKERKELMMVFLYSNHPSLLKQIQIMLSGQMQAFHTALLPVSN